jgi:large subunit ribosomal protein L9
MKVILKSDVKGLGKKDDMVNASVGYAKNYLFPRNLAVEANVANMNEMDQKKKANKAKKDNELKDAKELKDKIKSLEIIIKAKAGEGERLFGSITAKDIAETLESSNGIKIDKKKILLKEAIKSIGYTTVDIKLYPKVIAKLKVKIEKA